MKIRTGFVTNSSGSSFTEINVENSELVNILKRYELLFERKTGYKFEICKFYGNKIVTSSSWGDCEPTESFLEQESIDDNIYNSIPKKYLMSLKKSINSVEENKYLLDLFESLKQELKDKEEIINKSYKKITYNSRYSGDLGGPSSESINEICDFRNLCPKCGQPLFYLEKKDVYENYDSKLNSWSFDEKNLKSFYCSNKKCQFENIIINTFEDIYTVKNTDMITSDFIDIDEDEIPF